MSDVLKDTLSEVAKAARKVKLSTLVSWAGGYALGALTGIFPWQSFLVFAGVTLILLAFAAFNHFRSSRVADFTPWELSLRDPDNRAAAAATRSNEHHLVVGQAIEVIPHPQLNSRLDVRRLGWSPDAVVLTDQQTEFDAHELLAQVGGYRTFDPPNGIKYSLVGTSYITSDSPVLELRTTRTNYFTLRSVLPQVTADAALRLKYGHLDPSKNRIPHSLCLHYVVRFSDGSVMAMRRDRRAAWDGGLWSFSGEEQLADHDFETAQPCLAWFERAFCEEVLPLRDDTPLEERWKLAAPLVESMRIWSVLLEEQIHNFSLLGFYQLNCDPDRFRQLSRELINRGIGTRDREGDFHLVQHADLLRLLVDGRCYAAPLFGGPEEEIRAEALHPTSRYRVFRLLRALKRGPLEVDDYEVAPVRAAPAPIAASLQ